MEMDSKDPPSMPSTPSTPRPPLFEGVGADKPKKKSLFRNRSKCFTVDTWLVEEGGLPAMTCGIKIPPTPVPLTKKVLAEFIGTLMLICAGTATAIVNQKTHGSETLVGLAASTGLAVMIIILSTGHISGAHLNPSVTIAFAALYDGRFSPEGSQNGGNYTSSTDQVYVDCRRLKEVY